MTFIRKSRLFTSLLLLAVFVAFVGFPVPVSFFEQYKKIGGKIEFIRVIHACPSEYIPNQNLDRVPHHGFPVIKYFFGKPAFSTRGIPKINAICKVNCPQKYITIRSNSLERMCKLQI